MNEYSNDLFLRFYQEMKPTIHRHLAVAGTVGFSIGLTVGFVIGSLFR